MISSQSVLFKRNVIPWARSSRKQSLLFPSFYSDFDSSLPKILEKTLVHSQFNCVEMQDRIKNLCEYNTLAREPIQGKLTLLAFQWLARTDDLTEEKLNQIKVLGWAIELVQSYFIIGDDIEDKSLKRCGKTCWHLLPDVGLLAMNDASILRTFIYEILKNNFDGTLLTKMVNYFNEAYVSINLGQHLDITLSRSADFTAFTTEQYNKFANFKTSYYTVKFPILVALALCGNDSKQAFQIVEHICTELGILLQMQNDLMDYIDYESASLKTSSDIQKGKCSWPAVAALQHCSASQRRLFESSYGRWEPENVNRILNLYKQLNIPYLYRQEENKRFKDILRQIKDLSADSIPTSQFFLQLVEFIRKYTTNIEPSCL